MGTPRDDEPGMGRLLNAWRLVSEAQEPTMRVRKALHKKQIQAPNLLEALESAVGVGVITQDDAAKIRKAEAARLEAIQVDTFSAEEYYKDEVSDNIEEPPFARAANQ
jgi:acyl-CoA dehydrogenase